MLIEKVSTAYLSSSAHGERGVIMEDNEEEEDNENYPMFTEHDDMTMGGDEDAEELIFMSPMTI